MSEYVVVVEHAGSNYSAYAPDVPGCIAAGETLDETVDLMREALQFHFEGLREEGMPIPQPTSHVALVEAA